jgi:hypothetical protein
VPERLLSLLSLRESRLRLRRGWTRLLWTGISVGYALVAMLLGGMLILERVTTGGYFVEIVTGTGSQWWDYPGLLALQPWGVLSLPFLSTITMLGVATGVGFGMTVATFLTVQLRRQRRAAAVGGTAGAGVIAGLSPALIGIVTLGACCSTTAAALAGLDWAAIAGGTTLDGVLLNNWYAGMFQVVVLYVSLLAQEQLLTMYGSAFGTGATERAIPPPPEPRRTRPAAAASLALRIGLLIGGVTWLLALPAEWTLAVNPTLSAGTLFQWIGQHGTPSLLAIALALAPPEVAGALRGMVGKRVVGTVLRAGLAALGFSLVGWFPSLIAATGTYGFFNEFVGSLGGSGAYGGIAPPFSGWGLLFRWGAQFLLLGAFLLALAARPDGTLELIAGSSSRASARDPPHRRAGWNRPLSGGSPPPASALQGRSGEVTDARAGWAPE